MATTSQKVLAAASTIGVAEAALAMAHTGGIGVIVGLAVGAAAFCSIDDIERVTGRKLPTPPTLSVPSSGQNKEHMSNQMSLGYRLLHGKSVREPQLDGEIALQKIDQQLAFQNDRNTVETEKLPDLLPTGVQEPLFSLYPDNETLKLGTTVIDGQRFDPHINGLFGNGLIASAVQGSGKSMLNGRIIEQAGKCGVPVVVLDHKGEYDSITELPFINGLRAGKEGKDFDLTAENADAFVEMVMQNHYQAMVNLPSYGSSWLDRASVVAAVGQALMRYAEAQRRSGQLIVPCLVFLDEAQLYIPQNVNLLPPEAQANKEVLSELSNAYFALVSNGRSNGYTVCFATQSLTYIAKWAIKSCQIKVFMRHAETNDLDMCERIISPRVATRSDIESFPKGVGVVFGFTTHPVVVKFDKKVSRDVSETPGIERLRQAKSTSVSPLLMAPLPVKPAGGKLTLEMIIDLANSGKIDTDMMLKMMERLPSVDASDERYTDPALVVGQNMYEEPEDEEELCIVLGKNANGGKVQISQEQFQLAVRLRKSGMSTGYRDLMEPFNLSEHHAKALNARIRQELGSEA